MKMNQKGIITIDFLFAFVLVMGFFTLMLTLSLTLTVVEISQYITFSASRAYYGAHISEVQQQQLANQKFNRLRENPVFAPLFENGWYELSPPDVGRLSNQFPEYDSGQDTDLFSGVGAIIIARVLDFRIPGYGSTTNTGDGQGSGFQAYIASYLSREPTTNECFNFNRERWKNIRNLAVSGGAPYTTNTSEVAYHTMMDNGC